MRTWTRLVRGGWWGPGPARLRRGRPEWGPVAPFHATETQGKGGGLGRPSICGRVTRPISLTLHRGADRGPRQFRFRSSDSLRLTAWVHSHTRKANAVARRPTLHLRIFFEIVSRMFLNTDRCTQITKGSPANRPSRRTAPPVTTSPKQKETTPPKCLFPSP